MWLVHWKSPHMDRTPPSGRPLTLESALDAGQRHDNRLCSLSGAAELDLALEGLRWA